MEIMMNNLPLAITTRRNPELPSGNFEPGKNEMLPQKYDQAEKTERVQLDEEQVKAAVEQINKTLALHNTRLEFSIHEKTKGIMVKVVDETTGDLIREVPPERVLDMVAMTWEELGLLIDEKA
ncbi:MAG: flagellar protein FlaG [Syntrophomonadaceae bacterium]|nr:flagellar protein FlaG [Syntrophomonadaceae bacterium]